MTGDRSVRVVIEGSGRWVDVAADRPLLGELREAGIALPSDCGGAGTCGDCRVRFTLGAPAPTVEDESLFEAAEVLAGWRLACQARPAGAARIEVPPATVETGLRIVTEATGEGPVARSAARPGATDVGLAVDIGTTTVACFLVDGASGRAIDVAAFPNPQRAYGADVISRIVHAHREPGGVARLQEDVVEAIEWHALELCRRNGIGLGRVSRLAAVGNNTMTHLLWGIDPWPLGVAPFEPVFTDAPDRPARELGFRLLGGMTVRLVPGIAGHLGADTVAGILALGLDAPPDPAPRLLVDLGTNGEMVLVADGRAMACSTAAGPAFEGVHISSGMPAVEGAIEHVDLVDGDLRLETIGGVEPRGVCGSGLADAVTALLVAGILEPSGRMIPAGFGPAAADPSLGARIREGARGRAVALHEGGRSPVRLTQQDVRQVQLAKAAFRTGIDHLLAAMRVAPTDLARVHVAGGFGSHLRPASLVALGVLPPEVHGRIRSVGNVAGLGARLALGPDENTAAARRIAAWVEHLRLEQQPGFMDDFTDRLAFPVP